MKTFYIILSFTLSGILLLSHAKPKKSGSRYIYATAMNMKETPGSEGKKIVSISDKEKSRVDHPDKNKHLPPAYNDVLLLHYSVNGYHKGISHALKNGANINARDNTEGAKGETPLMKAAINNDIATAKLLFKHKANVNDRDERQETALLKAALLGHANMVRLLVEHGANVNFKNKARISPLFIAADHNHVDIVKYLITKGAKAPSLPSGYSVLMASAKNSPESLTIFLKQGMDPNRQNNKGATALMEAACANNPHTLKILIEHGANLSHKNKSGKGILEYLLLCHGMYRHQYSYQQDILRFIYDSNPELIQKLNNRETFHALLLRAVRQQKQIDHELIYRYIDLVSEEILNSTGSEGNTVLDKMYDRFKNNPNWLISYLEKKGALSPRKDLILKLNKIYKDAILERRNRQAKTYSPRLKEGLHSLISVYGLNPVLRRLRYGGNYQLLSAVEIYPEQYFGDRGYVTYLCKNDREDVLINYYEKYHNFKPVIRKRFIDPDGDGWLTDFTTMKTEMITSCGVKSIEKMIEKNDPILYKALPLGYIIPRKKLDFDDEKTAQKLQKLKLVFQHALKNPETQILKELPRYTIKQFHDPRWLMMMLEYPVDIAAVDKDGKNLLHLFLRRQLKKSNTGKSPDDLHLDALKLLLKKGVEMDARDNDGNTPLIHAVRTGYYSAVKLLISRGADLDHKNNYNEDALFYARLYQFSSIEKLLRKELSKTANKPQKSDLFFNEVHKQKSIPGKLLKKYNLYFSSDLLKYAKAHGYPVHIEPLDFYVRHDEINTCRVRREIIRMKEKDTALLKIFLSHGYFADCLQNGAAHLIFSFDANAMAYAIFKENREVIKLLLHHGADPNYTNMWGKSYFDMFYSYHHQNIMQYLRYEIENRSN